MHLKQLLNRFFTQSEFRFFSVPLICRPQRQKFSIATLDDVLQVKVKHFKLNSFVIALSMNLLQNHFQLLAGDFDFGQEHQEFLIASSTTWVITSERNQLFSDQFNASLLSDLLGSNPRKIAILVDHSGGRLQTVLLNGHPILPDEQHPPINQQQYGHCPSPQKHIARERFSILSGDGPHIDKPDIGCTEHLHRDYLDSLELDVFGGILHCFHVVLELLGVDGLLDYGVFHIDQFEDRYRVLFQGDLEGCLYHF